MKGTYCKKTIYSICACAFLSFSISMVSCGDGDFVDNKRIRINGTKNLFIEYVSNSYVSSSHRYIKQGGDYAVDIASDGECYMTDVDFKEQTCRLYQVISTSLDPIHLY